MCLCSRALIHRIPVTDNEPWHEHLLPSSPSDKKEVEKVLRRNLEVGLIEPTVSPCVSRYKLVRKPNGRSQIASSLIQLNDKVIKDTYPLPLISDLLDTISEAKFLSSIDVCGAYLSIPVHPKDRFRLAFITHLGVYTWTRLPYGMKNSGAAWCRVLDAILSGLLWRIVASYSDDIMIYGGNCFTQHVHAVNQVLHRLHSAGLHLSIAKCMFFKTQHAFLGYQLSPGSISPSPANVEKLLSATVKTVQDVRAFIGLAQWNRRFIAGFSQAMFFLYAYTKKGAKPPFSENALHAIKYVKVKLAAYPVLRFPNFSLPWFLATDASKEGCGAVLYQEDEKEKYVVAYASCALKPNQTHYAPHMLECLAAVWAMIHLRHYLQGTSFTLLTDCNALSWLRKKNLQGPMARWAIGSQCFDFIVKHLPGHLHHGPDFLSRAGACTANPPDLTTETFRRRQWNLSDCLTADSSDSDTPTAAKRVEYQDTLGLLSTMCIARGQENSGNVHPYLPKVTRMPFCTVRLDKCHTRCYHRAASHTELLDRDKWIELQQADDHVSSIREAISTKQPNSTQLAIRRWYLLEQDLVLYKPPNSTQPARVVVPATLKSMCVSNLHGMLCHPSARKTLRTLGRKFYWPKMSAYVRNYIRGCLTCRRRKESRQHHAGLTQPMLSTKPFSWISIDFLHRHMPTSREGYCRALMLICIFTRWPIVIPMRSDTDVEELAEALFTQVFSQHGFPRVILSDNARVFLGDGIEWLFTRMGISRRLITFRHPEGNAHCERFGRYCNTALSTTLVLYCEWPRTLPQILFVYRVVPHETTGYSPYFLLYGRHPVMPMALSTCLPEDTQRVRELQLNQDGVHTREVQRYADDLVTTLHDTFRHVRTLQYKAALANKARRDQKRYTVTFQPNDYVLKWEPGHRRECHTSQRETPFAGMDPTQTKTTLAQKLPQRLKLPWSGPWRVPKMISANVALVEVHHPANDESRQQARLSQDPQQIALAQQN